MKRRKLKETKRESSSQRRASRAMKVNIPRTVEEYFRKSEQYQDRWNRAAHVVSKMRSEGISLCQAAREFGLDPRTVTRLAGSALRKTARGRYAAKRSDRLLRVLSVPTERGLDQIAVRDSREASRVGKYSAAVRRYLQTGDASALRKFQDKSIKAADGSRVPLISDLGLLRRLGSAGVVSFESLYGRTA